ncbi:MAG: serine acetyltransferase [Deltaproteobacteria bacterium]|nr:serine acetyltransferase [Deltaproteobacteria bacterium]
MNLKSHSYKCLPEAQAFSEFDLQALARELLFETDPHHPKAFKPAITLPNPEAVNRLLDETRHILFPGYLDYQEPYPESWGKKLESDLGVLFKGYQEQISLSFPHDCKHLRRLCTYCQDRGHEKAAEFLQGLPKTKALLQKDIQAAFEGDPAAKSLTEIIVSYPGFFAITIYRIAHALHGLGVPLLPRMMTEYAHSRTGIDIHPGASIGEHFFIDHGTGVVIGETTVIGDRVRIYQGVTLGALSLPRNAGDLYRHKKRHPTIEDDVIIYANATILGGETIIGAGTIIGGNVWITESVPPDTKVILKHPEPIYLRN